MAWFFLNEIEDTISHPAGVGPYRRQYGAIKIGSAYIKVSFKGLIDEVSLEDHVWGQIHLSTPTLMYWPN